MNEQIIINFRVNAEQAKREMDAIGKRLRNNYSDMESKAFAKAQQSTYVATQKLNAALKGSMGLPRDFAKGFTDVNAEILQASGGMPKVANGVTYMNNAVKGANASLEKMQKNLKGAPFQGWAMSLMFAGMALQRMAQSMYKFGTKAFQEISHSVEGTVTQTDMLEGSMKYLGFTIGQALEPVVGFLIPIVDTIAQWVENNPELTQFGIILLGIVGTLAMVGGSARLAWTNGLQPFLTAFSSGGMFSGISTAIGGVTTALGGIGIALGILAAIIIVIIALWKTNLGGFRDFIKDTFGVLWETIKTIFSQIWKIIKTVMDIVVAIFQGDWDKVFALTWKLVKQIVALFLDALMGIGALVVNILVFAWNMVVDLILKIVAGLMVKMMTMWIDAISWIVSKLRNISEALGLGTGIFDRALNTLDKMRDKALDLKDTLAQAADSIKGGYISGSDLREGFANVDAVLGLGTPVAGSTTNNNTVINNNITIENVDNGSDFMNLIDNISGA